MFSSYVLRDNNGNEIQHSSVKQLLINYATLLKQDPKNSEMEYYIEEIKIVWVSSPQELDFSIIPPVLPQPSKKRKLQVVREALEIRDPEWKP